MLSNYYLFREGKPEIEKPQLKATAASTDLTTIKQSELLKAVSKTHAEKIVLKEAPPEYEFIADPPSISGVYFLAFFYPKLDALDNFSF